MPTPLEKIGVVSLVSVNIVVFSNAVSLNGFLLTCG